MLKEKFLYENINSIYNNIRSRNFFIKKINFIKIINFKKNLMKLFSFIFNNKRYFYKNKKKKYFFNIIKYITKNFIKKINNKVKKMLIKLPNLIHWSVKKKNLLIKKWGKKKKKNKKNHIEIGKVYGLDFKSTIKISGYGFIIIKEPILILYKAIIKFMLKTHKTEHNYKEIIVPYIINLKSILYSGQIPKFKNEIFFLEKKCLIPTAEVYLVNIFQNKIIKKKTLPIKLMSLTSCFRKEKKCYGKKNKGLIKQLQFDKIELITITEKKNSYKNLIEVIKYVEKVLKKIKIPYRIILLSVINTGITSCKTYDIEAWLPSINSYLELSSCSNTENFQSIRLNLKYKNLNETEHPHIINASGLAIGRTLVAIIENYQSSKNLIKIPKILQKYIYNKKKIKKI